mmetsp:Transcript_105698/g.329411  ORF Transcript_105698/g.329411 Transcript_105698/m.329411 type:complete len:197 (-) Transcript_105698:253-843(-)
MAAQGNATPVLVGTTIQTNFAKNYGGGLALTQSAAPVLDRCHVSGNYAHRGGGLVLEGQAKPVLNKTLVWWNTAATGGGLFSTALSPEICAVAGSLLIRNNNASVAGGGCFFHFDDQVVELCDGVLKLQHSHLGNKAPAGAGVWWVFAEAGGGEASESAESDEGAPGAKGGKEAGIAKGNAGANAADKPATSAKAK